MKSVFFKFKNFTKGLKTWTKVGILGLTSIYFYSYYEEIFYNYFPINKRLSIATSEIKSHFDLSFLEDEFVVINTDCLKSNKIKDTLVKTTGKSWKNKFLICEVFPKNLMELEQIFIFADKFKFPVVTIQEDYFILNKKYYIKLNLSKFNELKFDLKNNLITLNPGIKLKDVANRLAALGFKIKGLEKEFLDNIEKDYFLFDILHNPFYDDVFESFNNSLTENLVSFKIMSPNKVVTCINNDSNSLVYSNIRLNYNLFLKTYQILGIVSDIIFRIEPIYKLEENLFQKVTKQNYNYKLVFSNINNDVAKFPIDNICQMYSNKDLFLKYLKEHIGLELNLNDFSELIFKSIKAKVNNDQDVFKIVTALNKYLNSLSKDITDSFSDNLSIDKNSIESTNSSSQEKRFQGLKFIRNKKKYNFDTKTSYVDESSDNVYFLACYNPDNKFLEISIFKNSNIIYIDNCIKTLLKFEEICDELNIGLKSEELILLGNFEENVRRILGVNQYDHNEMLKKYFDSNYVLNPHLSIQEPGLLAKKMRSNKLLNYVIEKYKIL